MPNLDNLISFPIKGAGQSSRAEWTPIPPSSSHILVTDTTDSPALFVLTHFLRASHEINKKHRAAAAVRPKGKLKAHTKVIWLGCNSDGFVHLKNVARKSGVHLDEELRDEAFCYIDLNEQVLNASAPDEIADDLIALRLQDAPSGTAQQALIRFLAKVSEQLSNTSSAIQGAIEFDWTSSKIVIVDDLTALAWTLDSVDSFGQPIDVARQLDNWLVALTSLAAKNQASVVTLMHADATSSSKNGASDPTDESLFNSLLHKADVWIEVKELGSGRARDCDGEITVHPLVRPSLARALSPASKTSPQRQPLSHDTPPLQAFAIETPCPKRSKAVLYRIAPDGQSAALGGASIGSNTGRVQIWARGTGRGFL
ncbi:uncharacterized protein MEPE_00182 [Melanopsichium pennsylvanicum]|uniref:Uncharacterized protein n=2 Tax=Melanopsichium pennsylvanicum TaxID=63383 RepID=A0AAJ4XG48_9BASI|nr:conserved hypothetical protein [Melanopsichium pennsylvanicum 4]SNX81477.1 uncharacterized protein MEPE_00182 [Melanopsichium pennsylvanicum]